MVESHISRSAEHDGLGLSNDFLWVTWLVLGLHLIWFRSDHELYGLIITWDHWQFGFWALAGFASTCAVLFAPVAWIERPKLLAGLSITSVVAMEILLLSSFLAPNQVATVEYVADQMTLDEQTNAILVGVVFLLYRILAILWLLTRMLHLSPITLRLGDTRQLIQRVVLVMALCLVITTLLTGLTQLSPTLVTILLGSFLQLALCRSAPRARPDDHVLN